jgi:two-component system chemotaxis response regulator CheY
LRVLIADDEPGTRLMLAEAVGRLGHECTQAEDGAHALQLFYELAPEVVITDWDMPELDGTALARGIRAAPDMPYTYVIVLTGRADEDAARTAIRAGADDLVIKPLDPVVLERKLIAAERTTGLHRQLHGDARQDALTGVGNRRRLTEDLAALSGRVARYGHIYCVALFDIDHFKALNDRAGHVAGDEVLRAVGRALADAIRGGDTMYRYGGEEFLVVLSEQTLESGARAGERLRAAVEALHLEHPDGGPVTVCAGVAGPGSPSCSSDELIALADRALYRAKELGRNRVEIIAAAAPEPAEPVQPAQPAEPVQPAQPAEAEPTEPSVRLLIADDDEAIRLTLSSLATRHPALELIGAAADAEEAIELARQHNPDVVLLDVSMPAGGGLRAATAIREMMPDARLVALSAHDGPDVQLDMARAGAIGYLVKGASDEDIVSAIRSAARW